MAGVWADGMWQAPRVVVEVVEHPALRGCSDTDRRWFRRSVVRLLLDEFGDRIDVRWDEASAGAVTRPVTMVNGEVVHDGGFLPHECLRPVVARALGLEWAVLQDCVEARMEMNEAGIEAADWQDGLLGLLQRRFGDEPDTPGGGAAGKGD